LAFVIPTDNGIFLWFDEPTELPTITFTLRHLSHSTEKIRVFFLTLLFSFLFSFGKNEENKSKTTLKKKRGIF